MAKIVEPGEVIEGRWRIESELGEGGAGYVVKALDLERSELVALKFLLPSAAKDPELVQRFHREAKAASMLHSAPAIRVFEVREIEGGRHVMAMELLEGRDLGQIIEQEGRLEVTRAVDFLIEAMDAVAEAHSLGIVHRDLKPANLFICEDEHGSTRVKVLDFGISKVKSASARLTRTASLLGSPEYMPPEQLQGAKNVDARCDIWALGIILYELVSGQLPFLANNEAMLTVNICTRSPAPLSTTLPDAPEGLEGVILRCLEKHPKERFQSVADLAEALAPFAGNHGKSMIAQIRDRLPEDPAYSQRFSLVLGAALLASASRQSGPTPVNLAKPMSEARAEAPAVASPVAQSSPAANVAPEAKKLPIVPIAIVAMVAIVGLILLLSR